MKIRKNMTPEDIEQAKKDKREYQRKPEYKAKVKERNKKNIKKIIEKQKKYRNKPAVKERMRVYANRYYHANKETILAQIKNNRLKKKQSQTEPEQKNESVINNQTTEEPKETIALKEKNEIHVVDEGVKNE